MDPFDDLFNELVDSDEALSLRQPRRTAPSERRAAALRSRRASDENLYSKSSTAAGTVELGEVDLSHADQLEVAGEGGRGTARGAAETVARAATGAAAATPAFAAGAAESDQTVAAYDPSDTLDTGDGSLVYSPSSALVTPPTSAAFGSDGRRRAKRTWRVEIPDVYERREADNRAQHLYHIVCHYGTDQWHVWRRYEDFVELHESRILEAFDSSIVPAFPRRSFWSSLFKVVDTAEVVCERQWQLERYLATLLSDERLRRALSSVHAFLRVRTADRHFTRLNGLAAFTDTTVSQDEADFAARQQQMLEDDAALAAALAASEAAATFASPAAFAAAVEPRERGFGVRRLTSGGGGSRRRRPPDLLLPPPPNALVIPSTWSLVFDAAPRDSATPAATTATATASPPREETVFPETLIQQLNDALERLTLLQHRLYHARTARAARSVVVAAVDGVEADEIALLALMRTFTELGGDDSLARLNRLLASYVRVCMVHADRALDWIDDFRTFGARLGPADGDAGDASGDSEGADGDGATGGHEHPVDALWPRFEASTAHDDDDDDEAAVEGGGGAPHLHHLHHHNQPPPPSAVVHAPYTPTAFEDRVRTLEQRADALAVELVAGDTATAAAAGGGEANFVNADDRGVRDFGRLARLEEAAAALRRDASDALLAFPASLELPCACARGGPCACGRRGASSVQARCEAVMDECSDVLRALREARSSGSTVLPERRIAQFEQRLYALLGEAQSIEDAARVPPPSEAFAGGGVAAAAEAADGDGAGTAVDNDGGDGVASRAADSVASRAPPAKATTHRTAAAVDAVARLPTYAAAPAPAAAAADMGRSGGGGAGGVDASAPSSTSPVLPPRPLSRNAAVPDGGTFVRTEPTRRTPLTLSAATTRRQPIAWPSPVSSAHVRDIKSKTLLLMRDMGTYRRALTRFLEEEHDALRREEWRRAERRRARGEAGDDAAASRTSPASTAATARLNRQHLLDRLEDLQENVMEFEFNFSKRFSDHFNSHSSLFQSLVAEPASVRQRGERRAAGAERERALFEL